MTFWTGLKVAQGTLYLAFGGNLDQDLDPELLT